MAIDPTSSPMSIALQGLKRSFDSIAQNASKVANYGTSESPEGSLAEPLIEIKQDIQTIEAISRVIKATNDAEDEVLDIIA